MEYDLQRILKRLGFNGGLQERKINLIYTLTTFDPLFLAKRSNRRIRVMTYPAIEEEDQDQLSHSNTFDLSNFLARNFQE